VRSADGAKTWSPFAPAIPTLALNDPHGFVYNAAAQAFVVWQKGGKAMKLDYPIASVGLAAHARTNRNAKGGSVPFSSRHSGAIFSGPHSDFELDGSEISPTHGE
jgi:hypothetical protein